MIELKNEKKKIIAASRLACIRRPTNKINEKEPQTGRMASTPAIPELDRAGEKKKPDGIGRYKQRIQSSRGGARKRRDIAIRNVPRFDETKPGRTTPTGARRPS